MDKKENKKTIKSLLWNRYKLYYMEQYNTIEQFDKRFQLSIKKWDIDILEYKANLSCKQILM